MTKDQEIIAQAMKDNPGISKRECLVILKVKGLLSSNYIQEKFCECSRENGYSITGSIVEGKCISVKCNWCGGFVPEKEKDQEIKKLKDEVYKLKRDRDGLIDAGLKFCLERNQIDLKNQALKIQVAEMRELLDYFRIKWFVRHGKNWEIVRAADKALSKTPAHYSKMLEAYEGCAEALKQLSGTTANVEKYLDLICEEARKSLKKLDEVKNE